VRNRWGFDDFSRFAKSQRRQNKRLADGALGGATNLASPVASVPVGAPVPQTAPSTVVDRLWVVRTAQQSIGADLPEDIEFDEVYQQAGTALSWDAGAPTFVDVNEDGTYMVTGYLPAGVGGADPHGIIYAQLYDWAGTFDVYQSVTIDGAVHVGNHGMSVAFVGFLSAGSQLVLLAGNQTVDFTASVGGATGTGYGASIKAARIGA
jgi:hypothetical protein